ncbi:MAG: hypothetical protein AB7V01_07160 [Vicinamibacterales bacterium]
MMKKQAGKALISDEIMAQLSQGIPHTVANLRCLVRTLRLFGLSAAYERLDHPDVTPKACFHRAKRQLDVMAHHGDKWLNEDWLEGELARLKAKGGGVRFLLSNSSSPTTVARCKSLQASSSAFEARFFDGNAIFRAIFIDTTLLLLSHYGIEVIEKDWNNKKGWRSPQLLIEDNDHWSLLIPFRAIFRVAWEKASPLSLAPVDSGGGITKRAFQPEGE